MGELNSERKLCARTVLGTALPAPQKAALAFCPWMLHVLTVNTCPVSNSVPHSCVLP